MFLDSAMLSVAPYCDDDRPRARSMPEARTLPIIRGKMRARTLPIISESTVGGGHESVNIETHFNSMHLKEDVASSQVPVGPGDLPTRLNPEAARQLQNELLELKQQQQWQQQVLISQFKQQQEQLAKQHQQQQQELIRFPLVQFAPQQQIQHDRMILAQQQQQQQQQQLEAQKQKQQHLKQLLAKKDKPSANPSEEVKEKLHKFLLDRKQRSELAASGGASHNHSPPQAYRQWSMANRSPHGSVDHHSPPHNISAHYQPMFGQYDSNFPLRKTASDSNLKVRSRLKEKVTERRSHGSPLPRRRDGPGSLKRKPLTVDTSPSSSTPGSGPSSPLSAGDGANGLAAAAMPEDVNSYLLLKRMYSSSSSDVNLYTSPSLPNISLGLPPPAGSSQHSPQMQTASKPPMNDAMRMKNPLPGGPVIAPAFIPAAQPGTIMPAGVPPPMMGGMPLHEANSMSLLGGGAVAQRLMRPLARTQSAPLPTSQQQILMQQHQQHQQFLHQQQQQLMALQQRQQEDAVAEKEAEEAEHKQVQSLPLKNITEIKQEPIDIEEEDEEEEERLQLQQEQEELMRQQSLGCLRLTGTDTLPGNRPSSSGHRPLSRAQSSPAAASRPGMLGAGTDHHHHLHHHHHHHNLPHHHHQIKHLFTTGLAYDTLMLKHQCTCGNNAAHPEHPGRLQSIWARLQETGIANQCERIRTRKATLEELQSCHSEGYVLFYGTSQPNRPKLDSKKLACIPKLNFTWLPCGGLGVDNDTVWNDLHSPSAARIASGSVIELAFKVAAGELKNGFAVVRPPGHHAETSQAMGFCFFNSVAVAAKQLRLKLKLNKILIIDWDVHHGNSTQKIFYEDPHVLYISLHRHDEGNFFPGTGAPDECGCGAGLGYNVNIAFHGNLDPPMGDTEYLAAFRSVVLPIAREFSPDVVLVSAGFDAAEGHANPLGGYQVTPACFGYMTKQLMTLAGGRVVLALEGGYDLPAICDSSEVCAQVLLGDEGPQLSERAMTSIPNEKAVECLQRAIQVQSEYWTSVRAMGPLVTCSAQESNQLLQREKDEAETVTAMALLSVRQKARSEPMEEDYKDES
ncbi:histone deacetylase 4-like isoform X3 [Acanthaster planci]|uniref:Histone deacetylase n=1 Tax=Acanthaster planci TaxID=133434 RepID=A0A8B7Y4J9_ACAPL|nr:histone deacetylase 4-like isoform X3 [Acanthaster planci]